MGQPHEGAREGCGTANGCVVVESRKPRLEQPAKLWVFVAAFCVLATACTSVIADAESDTGSDHIGEQTSDESDESAASPSSATTIIEDYPDAIVRELQRQMRAPRPVPNSALPPRHIDAERFPELLVERHLIVSGGPPPDGIRSIDTPTWLSIPQVDWLADDESILVVSGEKTTHLYPTQIMLWHEIVNDVIDDHPITVTYCPLCNSAVAFDRRLGQRVLEFGTSGALYHSALVMYDRQTESLWTHFDGRSIVGDLMGSELELVPVQTMSWSQATQRWPDALVLDRPTGELGRRPYGISPYSSYEGMDEPLPGFFQGELDPRLPPRQRVVGLAIDGEAVAIDRRLVERNVTTSIEVSGRTIRLEHSVGVRSPLDGREVAEGVDIGSISAVALGDDGSPDQPVPVLDTFWFAWAAYHPNTAVLNRDGLREP